MTTITRATDYAVRVLVHLSGPNPPEHATRKELSAATGIPGPFLNKIVQRLVHHGILRARPGVGGGCSPACSLGGITLLRVVEIMEGPMMASECLDDPSPCPRGAYCSLRALLRQLQDETIRVLRSKSIGEMAAEGAGPAGLSGSTLPAAFTAGPKPCGQGSAGSAGHRSRTRDNL